MRTGSFLEWLGRRPDQSPDGTMAMVPVDQVDPSPYQPRKTIDQAELEQLATSIRQVGLLQPIVVRPVGSRYELIMGERRWRAAQAAGLREIRAIIRAWSDDEAAVAALVENLQRSDLSYWEEAEGYARVLETCSITQEQLAASVGKSQPAIANKLRLLRLPKEVKEQAQAAGLGERHARALLRLPDAQAQMDVLAVIVNHNLSAQQAEDYIARLLSSDDAPIQGEGNSKPVKRKRARLRRHRLPVIRDVRIMLNTFRQGIDALRQAGLDADLHTEERDDHIKITIRIPKE